ncbi:MAG: hypothetical protein CMN76_01300 [Spirochaetaceae bacterium]|nr:hypothetical protein [Spirochaetaceae bacterium]|tara:strand:- start:25629 stop:27893 length:2265 start_codon:yes stop_codon:yes gene_type:complete
MRKLVNRLLDDARSGVQKDASGRQFFRQRKVRFTTVYFDAAEMLESGWLEFDEQLESPYRRSRDPTPANVRSFAQLSSERFLHFYYRVFDVAVARALSTLDTNLFRVPFVESSEYLDLGIPEKPEMGSIPPALHKAIMEQYRAQPGFLSLNPGAEEGAGPTVSFLSAYLDGLTDDAIELLKPYRDLWELEDRLREIQNSARSIQFDFEAVLLSPNKAAYLERLSRSIADSFRKPGLQTVLQSIANPELRKSVRAFLLDDGSEGRKPALLHILRNIQRFKRFLDEGLMAGAGLAILPEKLEIRIRGAFLQEARLHARIMRYNFLRYRAAPVGKTTDLRLLHNQRNAARREALNLLDSISKLHPLALQWQKLIHEHETIRQSIRRKYENYLEGKTESDRQAFEPAHPSIFGKAAQRYGHAVTWPEHIRYGDPFCRREVLLHIKQQLLNRLRAVRSTTTGYSLIPGSRHGILPLNPVMKLWKEKPGFEPSLPELAKLEINTPGTVACLISLAHLVDRELYARELRLGRILKEKLGNRTLRNMQIFLMPGSCGAAREIERPDFPEFRNSVIGESRKPEELGVAGENAVLTGAWYKKRNHALYYPIGGDNGQLIRSIYLALRLPGPAAFFFALGQFVHDCLPDNLVYYAGSEIPFRQITEDYYRQEDRVRKNRGEKTGRRRVDNSRAAVRFMFAVSYSRIMMEALTGSSQSSFRHVPTEKWMSRYLNLPALSVSDRSRFRNLRARAREVIESFPGPGSH